MALAIGRDFVNDERSNAEEGLDRSNCGVEVCHLGTIGQVLAAELIFACKAALLKESRGENEGNPQRGKEEVIERPGRYENIAPEESSSGRMTHKTVGEGGDQFSMRILACKGQLIRVKGYSLQEASFKKSLHTLLVLVSISAEDVLRQGP